MPCVVVGTDICRRDMAPGCGRRKRNVSKGGASRKRKDLALNRRGKSQKARQQGGIACRGMEICLRSGTGKFVPTRREKDNCKTRTYRGMRKEVPPARGRSLKKKKGEEESRRSSNRAENDSWGDWGEGAYALSSSRISLSLLGGATRKKTGR